MKMRKILRHTALTSVTALAVAVAAPGQAETTTTVSAPYTRGQICHRYLSYSECSMTPPPPGYGSIAVLGEPARGGELVVGGWDQFRNSVMVNVYRAASMVEFWAPSTVGPISASAQIAGFNYSSPYETGFRVCLKIIDLGPMPRSDGAYGYGGGGGPSPYPADLAVDCFGKSTPFRALSATASSVPGDHKIKVEVSLDNRYDLGVARATVSSISYTLP